MSSPNEEMMASEDARLLAELGQALGPSTQPPGLVERVEALVVFADFDRQLARLMETESGELVGTRGAATPTEAMRFQVDYGSVAVEVLVARGRLSGQVLAGAIAEVVLEPLSGPAVTAAVDDLGQFAFEQPGTGPVRLGLRGVQIGPTPVATDWFLP
jgi:hypothetical protein